MFKGCAKWVFVGILVAVFLIIISIFWGNSVASRKAEPNPVSVVTVPVVPNPPKVETAPEPAKTEPVKVPDPPKAEVPETKDPTTAKPGDIVGAVKPEIKDWPTSQTLQPGEPTIFFSDPQVWKESRRRVSPDGGLTGFAEVLFMVTPGTAITLPFDVLVKNVGTDAKISTFNSRGERSEAVVPKLVSLSILNPKDRDRQFTKILLAVPSNSEVKDGKITSGEPIVIIPEWDYGFVDAVADQGGAVRLMRFNVFASIASYDPKIVNNTNLKGGTRELFVWFIDWWTGKVDK